MRAVQWTEQTITNLIHMKIKRRAATEGRENRDSLIGDKSHVSYDQKRPRNP